MSTPNSMQTPPFLTKLYQLVTDPQTSALVSWTDEKGLSFTVHKPSEFGRDILPRYFKHNNFSSFVRQLNQYGFHKQNPDKWMFGHDSFRKDRPDLLKHITRRRPKQTAPTSNAVLPHTLAQKAIVELGNYGIEGEVKSLKRDKDLLIQELVVTRRNEEQLRNKCTSLEDRVTNLEDSSKQMQAFIMHYFSQVLQPYSQAMVSRKRKRLPPSSPSLDAMDGLVEPQQNAVANVSHSTPNPSVDALRVMMQQMGVGMPPTPTATRTSNPNTPIVDLATDGRTYAPATIQELPQDDQANGGSMARSKTTIPRIGPPAANGNAPTVSQRRAARAAGSMRSPPHLTRNHVSSASPRTPHFSLAPQSPTLLNATSPAPVQSLLPSPIQSAVANPNTDIPYSILVPGDSTPFHPELVDIDPVLQFLEEIPSTPNSSMTMDLIDTVLEEPKDHHADERGRNPSGSAMPVTAPRLTDEVVGGPEQGLDSTEYEITFDTSKADNARVMPCSGSRDDERTLEAFLELSGDDQQLPPPLTHLPEGTDMHALAKRIESFADTTGD